MCHIGPYVHQMADTAATLPLSIALEEFANLEEQHDEDGLRKLCFGSRQEADTKSTDGGDRHEEMLIEGIAVSNTLDSLLQRVVTYY